MHPLLEPLRLKQLGKHRFAPVALNLASSSEGIGKSVGTLASRIAMLHHQLYARR